MGLVPGGELVRVHMGSSAGVAGAPRCLRGVRARALWRVGSNPALPTLVRETVAQLVSLPARIETSTLGEKAALHGPIAIAIALSRRGRRSSAAPATADRVGF